MDEQVKVEETAVEYVDETLHCVECGNDFVFTAGEQAFYAEKGYTNKPKRCRACRNAKKNAGKPEREYFETVCSECGGVARVPFNPSKDKPVYCSACHEKRRREKQENEG